jgi:hypothetical protein
MKNGAQNLDRQPQTPSHHLSPSQNKGRLRRGWDLKEMLQLAVGFRDDASERTGLEEDERVKISVFLSYNFGPSASGLMKPGVDSVQVGAGRSLLLWLNHAAA